MSDPLTDAANAISNSSPKIRTFAQLTASRIEADEAEQAREAADLGRTMAALTSLTARVTKLEGTPAPPPVGKHVGNGFQLFRLGNSWTAGNPLLYGARYGLVAVGYGNDTDAAHLSPAVGCGYRTAIEVPDVANIATSFGGVSKSQATTLGALLHDAAGNLLHPSSGVYAGDVGNPAYQDAHAANVLARLQATGLHAFYYDNFVPNCWFGTPAGMFGGLSFSNAMVSFAKETQAKMPGIYRIANCGPGGSTWAAKIAPYFDGLLNENPSSESALGEWMDAVQNAGKDAFVLITGDPASAAVKSWAQAFAANWNHVGGGFGVDHGDPDPWNANWTSVIV
jgi:hypothetical protein